MIKAFLTLCRLLCSVLGSPKSSLYDAKTLPFRLRGKSFGAGQFAADGADLDTARAAPNPLAEYFEAHNTGAGLFKWTHYFEIYHRHLSKFAGQNMQLLEVGIYSGGSLEMWRHYLGVQAHLYGVDIQESCRAYQGDNTSILIGDQGDRSFWRWVKHTIPLVDIIIDDGGHLPEQQSVTLEEMLPHLRPGGVYICEDIHGQANNFAAYVHGLSDDLNAGTPRLADNWELSVTPTSFQSAIHSIHFYPFVVVIEKATCPLKTLDARRQGTDWQPFH